MLLFVMLLLNSVFSPIQQTRYIDVSISAFQKTFENLQVAWCFLSFYGDVMYPLNRSFNSPSPFHRGHTLGIWHLYRTGEEGIWLSESSRGWGIWTIASILCEISGRFAQAIMADAVLEDFCAKDCSFVVNWLQGKSLNKLFALFKGI